MTECSVGIVGAGIIATSVHIPVLRAMDGVRIAWIADAREDLAASVARLNGTAAASVAAGAQGLPPADVVLLAIPVPARAAYLDHYKGGPTSLLLEKPLANSFAEHQAIEAAFAPWQVAACYQRRYYAASQLVASILSSATFGPLRRIRVSEGGRVTRTDGGGDYKSQPVSRGGGVVKNLGCHSLDQALWLAGAKDFEIERREVAWDGETDQACRARITLKDATNGPLCELDWSISWIERVANHVEFDFADATLRCPVSPDGAVELLSPGGQLIGPISAEGPGRATTTTQAFFLQWRGMISSVQSRSEQPISARSTALCARLMDALLER
jgi:predicted dehydrogenase